MRHHHFQQFQENSDLNGLDLEPYIIFEKERISRKRVVFHSIRFHLDKDILLRIQQAQETGRRLYISRQLLADLRDYALVGEENSFQSGLTFYSYYLRGGAADALMRSVISMDGDIFHQIRSDCLERPNFCRQIASAHYWLITQLLARLRLRAFLQLHLLPWGLSLLITGVVIIPLILLLIKVNLWLLLPLVIIAWLLQMVLQRLLRLLLPRLRRCVLRQMLSGLLSRKPWEKKIAKGILARFGS